MAVILPIRQKTLDNQSSNTFVFKHTIQILILLEYR